MRIIDGDAIEKDWYTELHSNYKDDYAKGFQAGLLTAIRYPTIEAEPVVHGRWIHDINNLYGCSECLGRETMSHKRLKPYCPNCGAKMDGGI